MPDRVTRVSVLIAQCPSMPMLEDLDSLAARIEQAVAFTRELRAGHEALQAQLRQLGDERDALAETLRRREQDVEALRQQLAEGEQAIAGMQHQGEALRQQFALDLEQYKARCSTLESQLAASRHSGARLREASLQAREQIDSILVRLPGAPQE